VLFFPFFSSNLHQKFPKNVFIIINIINGKHIASKIKLKLVEKVHHNKRVAKYMIKLHRVDEEFFCEWLVTVIYSFWP